MWVTSGVMESLNAIMDEMSLNWCCKKRLYFQRRLSHLSRFKLPMSGEQMYSAIFSIHGPEGLASWKHVI